MVVSVRRTYRKWGRHSPPVSRVVRRCERGRGREVFSSALTSNLLETVGGAPLSTFPVLDVAWKNLQAVFEVTLGATLSTPLLAQLWYTAIHYSHARTVSEQWGRRVLLCPAVEAAARRRCERGRGRAFSSALISNRISLSRHRSLSTLQCRSSLGTISSSRRKFASRQFCANCSLL